jgi:hypothetical protein
MEKADVRALYDLGSLSAFSHFYRALLSRTVRSALMNGSTIGAMRFAVALMMARRPGSREAWMIVPSERIHGSTTGIIRFAGALAAAHNITIHHQAVLSDFLSGPIVGAIDMQTLLNLQICSKRNIRPCGAQNTFYVGNLKEVGASISRPSSTPMLKSGRQAL